MSTQHSDTATNYRQAVLDEWTGQSTIEAWRKWHPKIAVQLQGMSDALLEASGVRPGQQVLDLASGTGLPAIDIARVVGSGGQVTATDLSAEFIDIIRDNARAAGLGNLVVDQLDAETRLPYPDGSFDAVSSRLGAMYFIDFPATLREIHRVLKKGGRTALAVWGPADRGTYVEGMLGPFFKRIELPEVPPDAPSPFRFAAAGRLADELRRAGFEDVSEQTLVVPAPWPGTPEEYWQEFYEVAVPMRPLFDSLPREQFEAARAEAVALLAAHYDGRQVNTTVATVVASGRR